MTALEDRSHQAGSGPTDPARDTAATPTEHNHRCDCPCHTDDQRAPAGVRHLPSGAVVVDRFHTSLLWAALDRAAGCLREAVAVCRACEQSPDGLCDDCDADLTQASAYDLLAAQLARPRDTSVPGCATGHHEGPC